MKIIAKPSTDVAKSYPAFGLVVLAITSVVACGEETLPDLGSDSENLRVRGPEPVVAPPVADEPPPLSEEVATVAQVTRSARDSLAPFRSDRIQLGARRVLAVRATVVALDAKEKVLPRMLSWGDDGNIATRVGLTVDEVLCGAPPAARIDAWYAGGVLPDGSGYRTSTMPSDLAVGSTFVFWLTEYDGDWYLARGRMTLHRDIGGGTLESYYRHEQISKNVLMEVCR